MWGLSSARISSLHNSVYLNPPKTACGYPCGGVIKKKNTVTHAVLSTYDMLLSMYIHCG